MSSTTSVMTFNNGETKCATLVEQQAALKPLNAFIQARFAMSMADLASDCAALHQANVTPANS